jgi:hypothetical protein
VENVFGEFVSHAIPYLVFGFALEISDSSKCLKVRNGFEVPDNHLFRHMRPLWPPREAVKRPCCWDQRGVPAVTPAALQMPGNVLQPIQLDLHPLKQPHRLEQAGMPALQA